tara:strand:- start:550 stop:720 length:171 start_codon:yes stop_codon:yes gene_type:complete
MVNKIVSWIVTIIGAYLVLSLLIGGLPEIIPGAFGWIIGIIVLVVGIFLLVKKPAV